MAHASPPKKPTPPTKAMVLRLPQMTISLLQENKTWKKTVSETQELSTQNRPQDHPWYFTGYPPRVLNGSHAPVQDLNAPYATTSGPGDGGISNTVTVSPSAGLSMGTALAAVRQQTHLNLSKLFRLEMSFAEESRDPQLVMMLEAMKAAVVEYVGRDSERQGERRESRLVDGCPVFFLVSQLLR